MDRISQKDLSKCKGQICTNTPYCPVFDTVGLITGFLFGSSCNTVSSADSLRITGQEK